MGRIVMEEVRVGGRGVGLLWRRVGLVGRGVGLLWRGV